ncbi:MAG: UDP-N-acetylglucosamine 2-epimerase (non-hydrolyzing) [Thermoleophilia bacterium]|nr:UDP-N-acetylglucosamine 2-epimerase (non-hydrolyzing) [Thermoleophilia bacterium]
MEPTIVIAFGTRPEAIKMAPVVLELTRRGHFRVVTCLTGQHREMLDQVVEEFSLPVDYDLKIMRERQTLGYVTSAVLKRLDPILERVKPDLVMVHGDTTTTFAAALAAYYRMIPVAHVEAGLRTANIYSPFPEEMNRRLADRLAELLYAPTPAAREALLREGAPPEQILVTGNTVIDALLITAAAPSPPFEPSVERALKRPGPKVLVTVHRRESWGMPMERVAAAIARVCQVRPDVTFIFPIHRNPVVRQVFYRVLGQVPQVVFTEPLAYRPFVHVMKSADLVITDSGGIQEEAPTLGKPVLVMREVTERPEGIAAGTARLVGTDSERVASELLLLLSDRSAYEQMANAINPYGDGRAAQRIADHLEYRFGLRASPPQEFDGGKNASGGGQ